jgi:primosomal protein N' (replication factor Y)
LVEALHDRLAKGEQALLFLNRRGYAPLTLCRQCGHRFECKTCSAWLVEHRLSRRLACHHCGHEEPMPTACPECGTPDCLVACGPGVERIADEVAQILPDARVVVATSGHVEHARQDWRIRGGGGAKLIDVIVGTQLVTKGYHFPT